MELREVAAVSGRGGLFKILKPTKNGVILEALDASKKRFVAGANERVSILNEISIYTTDKEGSVALEIVLQKIHAAFGKDTKITAKSSNDELSAFLATVLPDYDREKVYHSDIKKLANWYTIILANFPEILVAKKAETKTAKAEEKVADAVTEEAAPAKKVAAKKAPKAEAADGEEKAAPAKKAAAKKPAKAKGE